MKKHFSRWGIVVALIHVVLAGAILIYSANCEETFCAAGAWFAVMPWLLLEGIDTLPVTGWTLISILVVVDTVILYIVFAGLERLLKK